MKLFAKTHFPEFDSSEVPDADEISRGSSDDEHASAERQEKYRTKEDQDVAVFMALAQKMSFTSLLHLLQGHVRAMNLPSEYMAYGNAYMISQQADAKKIKPLPKIKKFRFAEVSGGQVRTVVHEVKSVKHYKNIWWQESEMQAIRKDAIDAVCFFRKHRHDYTKTVEFIAESEENRSPKQIVYEHMKKLSEEHSFARGLEAHIVSLLSVRRQDTVRAVLKEQWDCDQRKEHYDVSSKLLCEQSREFSRMSRTFAAKIAECDQMDALKATMSSWEPDVPRKPKSPINHRRRAVPP